MSNYLTKSSVMSGLQCHKRLWMAKHDPLPRDENDDNPVLNMGTEVGKYAHNLFPGGQLVDAAPWEHQAAIAQTQKLMDDLSVPAIFEAAFEAEGIRVRVDILERLPRGRWRILEVKASTELKAEHVQDIAVQTWVVKQAGHKVESSHLLHINKEYVRGKNGIDCHKLFASVDISGEIKAFAKDLPDVKETLLAVLRRKTAPVIEPSDHCHTPYECEFWDRCTADKPVDWVRYLPHISAKKKEELKAAGIDAIRDIPQTFPLSDRQKVIRDVIASGKEWVSEELADVLATITPPCFYLDFETMNPAIPLYVGTKPYQRLPFQWSLHHVGKRGKLTHWEFLADGKDDPRQSFTESLIEALSGSTEPIVVYSGFENGVLRDMAKLYPQFANPIAGIQERLHDLLGTVRGHYCHPEFMGSYSIKDVGPVLAPDITYDDLELVANGSDASSLFALLASGGIAGDDAVKKLRQALLTYCERDTLAMVRVHEALLKAIATRGRHA
ncbi:MAG: DUF2779 domain-containing protein [Alphaproteobacteria bacterium]